MRTLFVIIFSLALFTLDAEDASKEMRLPPLKEAAAYVDVIVVGKVKRVHHPYRKESKPGMQCVVVEVEEVLKGDIKKGEELMAEFYEPTKTNPGYSLPLPDEFAKQGNRVILFLKVFVAKEKKDGKDVEQKSYVSVSPPPESGKLNATEENIEAVKKVLDEIEKAKKEFEEEQKKFKKKKSLTVKKPPMRVKRPSKDWYFVPLEAEKKMRLAKVVNEKMKEHIENGYENRLVELRNDGFDAMCTFYATEVEEDWKMDEMKVTVEKNIKEGYSESRITSRRKVVLFGKTPAWRFVWEAKVDGDVRVYVRYTAYVERNSTLYDVIMSVPKENYENVEKDFSKIIRYFKF